MTYQYTAWPSEARQPVKRIEAATAQLKEDIAAGMSTMKRRQVALCSSDFRPWISESCRAINDAAWQIVEMAPEWKNRPPEWYKTIRRVVEIVEAIEDNAYIVQKKAVTHWFETAMAYLEEMMDQVEQVQKLMSRIPLGSEEGYLIELPKKQEDKRD